MLDPPSLRKKGDRLLGRLGPVTCPLFFVLTLITSSVYAQDASLTFDHSQWDQFLKKFVNEKGEVNYSAAQKDPSLLQAYLGKIRATPLSQIDRLSREEKMALLINAFNAGVIRTILEHYPVKSVMNIPGGWEQASVQIGWKKKKLKPTEKEGKVVLEEETRSAKLTNSLNEIESNFLRKVFRDEKILFALSRGAKGSPRLRQEAYVGSKLEGQLYLATREFVNDESRNPIRPGGKKIILSRIFKWYGQDFMVNWGNFPEEIKWEPQEMAVLSFFAHYLDDPQKVEFLKNAKYKVKYSTFDWNLNDWVS